MGGSMKDLLERCETEMRYAGWTTLEVDNPQRQDLYFCVQAALAQPAQEPVGVFCEDDDIGYVRLIPHQQMKLKAWDKLYTAPQAQPAPVQEPVAGQPLPCPFCGHIGLDFGDGETYRWGIASCGGCGASCGEVRREYPDKSEWHTEAIAEWNRRSPAAQPAQEPVAWIKPHDKCDRACMYAPRGLRSSLNVLPNHIGIKEITE
jgi:hypothetical protein